MYFPQHIPIDPVLNIGPRINNNKRTVFWFSGEIAWWQHGILSTQKDLVLEERLHTLAMLALFVERRFFIMEENFKCRGIQQ